MGPHHLLARRLEFAPPFGNAGNGDAKFSDRQSHAMRQCGQFVAQCADALAMGRTLGEKARRMPLPAEFSGFESLDQLATIAAAVRGGLRQLVLDPPERFALPLEFANQIGYPLRMKAQRGRLANKLSHEPLKMRLLPGAAAAGGRAKPLSPQHCDFAS